MVVAQRADALFARPSGDDDDADVVGEAQRIRAPNVSQKVWHVKQPLRGTRAACGVRRRRSERIAPSRSPAPAMSCAGPPGSARDIATRPERDGATSPTSVSKPAPSAQPPQDLATAQQSRDEHGEEHEHDGFDGDQHGHQNPLRTVARSAGSESATSAARPAASATRTRNGTPASGWSAMTVNGRGPNAATAAATGCRH